MTTIDTLLPYFRLALVDHYCEHEHACCDMVPVCAQRLSDLLARARDLTVMGAAVADAAAELKRAQDKFPPFRSAHEGYAILLEEVEELWSEVRCHRDEANIARMRQEAIQVAAMALRFVVDVCERTATL
jgi:hypothetical protein